MTDYEFDFQISVSDDGAVTRLTVSKMTSTRVENERRGLVCQAFVKKKEDSSCTYEKSKVREYPCLRWDNFIDNAKSGAGKTALTLVNNNNEKIVGNMQNLASLFLEVF